MARIIRPAIADPRQYRGLEWIFEYTNRDGALTTRNCGQAAAATFLSHHGAMNPVEAARNMAWLEKHYPPDQFAGWLGTGRGRIESILRAFHIDYIEVNGQAEIARQLEQNNPVLLMVGMPSAHWLGVDWPGGHWMVAFGHEKERVHLSNWGAMTWDEIHAGWHSIAARWIRMNGRGLAKPPATSK
jgi:hypothetical protein